MQFKKSNPILFSTDIAASIKYYTDILGFKESWTWGDPIDFGGIVGDEVEIYFALRNQGSPGTWFTIIVDDIDAYYEFIKEKGATILSPPKTMEWNMREMLVQDPDKHIIRFGQNVECD